jgi:predicted CoA-binding protein
MSKLLTTPAEVSTLVNSVKVVAIVGVSDKPDRASNGVAKYLQDNSPYKLYFVNPLLDSVLGEKCYHSLQEIPEVIDLVDVFRKPSDMAALMDEAIRVGAKAFWMQLGIREEVQANRGVDAGMDVVQDLCLKVEYEKYCG